MRCQPDFDLRLAGLLALVLATAASGGDRLAAAEKPPTYEQDVLPIFKEKCCGCHNAGKRAGGLDLTSYQQMQAGGNSGDVLAAGDPDGSYLWQVASHESEPVMPPNADRIPDSMLAVLKKWIIGGLIERDGSKPMAAKPKTNLALDPGAIVTPEGDPILPPRLPLQVVSHGIRPTTITGLAASPHGDVVAIGGRRQVLLYSPASRQLRGVLPFPEGDCRTLRFSRNARLLLGGGGVAAKSGRVVLWDVASGKRLIELGDEYDEVLAADISADQRLVALGGSSKVVRLLTTADGQVESEITKHTDWITSLAFSPDSVLLATGDRAGNLFLWESFGAREWAVLKGHAGGITATSWRADGLLLATAAEDGTIHLWDADQGKKVRSWSAHGGGVADVRWLKDGRLVSTGRDRNVKLWKADGKLERDFGDLSDIGTCATVNDDQSLVIAADWAGRVEVFKLADGKRLGQIDSNPEPLEDRLADAERRLAAAQKIVQQKAAEHRTQQQQGKAKVAESEKRLAQADATLAEAKQQAAAAQQTLRAAEGRLAAATKQLAAARQAAAKAQEAAATATAAESEAGEKTAAESAVAAANKAVAAVKQAEASQRKAAADKDRAAKAHKAAAAAVAKAEAANREAAKARQQLAAEFAKQSAAGSQAVKQAEQAAAERGREVDRWRDEIGFAKQAQVAGI